MGRMGRMGSHLASRAVIVSPARLRTKCYGASTEARLNFGERRRKKRRCARTLSLRGGPTACERKIAGGGLSRRARWWCGPLPEGVRGA